MTTAVCLMGSVLGTILYTVYVGPVSWLIANHGVQHHQYSDDIQIFTRMTADQTLSTVYRPVSTIYNIGSRQMGYSDS